MNLNKLMKQAQKMQEEMAKTQAELESKTVEVSAGGGKVKVTANGAGDVLAIKIDKEIIDPNDVEFLEEMILSAVQQAVEQGKALAQSEMSKITEGLGLQTRTRITTKLQFPLPGHSWLIFSAPKWGCSLSGICTDPSGCW